MSGNARSGLDPGYIRPTTLDQLAALLDLNGGRSALLAGGQTLVSQLQSDATRWDMLIDLGGIPDLKIVQIAAERVFIGAMVTLTQVLTGLADVFPIVSQALAKTATPVVRNRATVGGSVALYDPASELLAALAAYDADVIELSSAGQVSRPIMARTHVPAGVAIIGISIPRAASAERAGFAEILRRRSGGRALAIALARETSEGLAMVTVSGSGLFPARLAAIRPGDRGALLASVKRLGPNIHAGAWLLAAATAALTNLKTSR